MLTVAASTGTGGSEFAEEMPPATGISAEALARMISDQIAAAIAPFAERLGILEQTRAQRRLLFDQSGDTDMQSLPWARKEPARSVEASMPQKEKGARHA